MSNIFTWLVNEFKLLKNYLKLIKLFHYFKTKQKKKIYTVYVT